MASDDPFLDEADPFGKEAHDEHNPDHSGRRGHFCYEYDDVWICEDCPEFEMCECRPKVIEANQ